MWTISLKALAVAAVFAVSMGACSGTDPYLGMDAEALFRMAENESAEGEYGNAIDVLERLRVSFGDWPRIADARLRLADAHLEAGAYLTARSEYQRWSERYVSHPLSVSAAMGQCRSLAGLVPNAQRDPGYTSEAITMCGNVAVDYPGTPEAEEAREVRIRLRLTMAEKDYLNADHYFRRKQFDPAIKYFQFVVDDYPDTDLAPLALLGIYESNKEIGYEDLADSARRQLIIEYPDSEEAAQVRAIGTES